MVQESGEGADGAGVLREGSGDSDEKRAGPGAVDPSYSWEAA